MSAVHVGPDGDTWLLNTDGSSWPLSLFRYLASEETISPSRDQYVEEAAQHGACMFLAHSTPYIVRTRNAGKGIRGRAKPSMTTGEAVSRREKSMTNLGSTRRIVTAGSYTVGVQEVIFAMIVGQTWS